MTFGEILRQAREDMGLSEKGVADRTQIPAKYIAAMEDGDISRLPPRVYSRGFLKRYAAFLGLPIQEMLNYFEEGWPISPAVAKKDTFSLVQAFVNFLNFDHKRAKLSFLLAGAMLVGVYFLYELRFAIGEPKIDIFSPKEDMIVEDDEISVLGSVEEGAGLILNGRIMYVNEKGEFSDSVLLRKGLNILEFEVKNRFGKINKDFRYIVLSR